ncbi:MAG: ATP-binding protein [bacterium]|nr:ATP-binding protein [Candidatus Sumerlaeota bacterium]
MNGVLDVVLKNDLSEIQRLSVLAETFSGEQALPSSALFDMNLVLEEIISNVIKYAYNDDGAHQIMVRLRVHGDELSIEVEDDGLPFNPLEAPTPDITQPLEERPIGGLGLHLVKKIMDTIQYSRTNGINHLVMRKRISGQ